MTSDASTAPIALARCNRSGSDTRKRSQLIAFRVSPDEETHIKALAEANGMSVGELMRLCFQIVKMQEEMSRG